MPNNRRRVSFQNLAVSHADEYRLKTIEASCVDVYLLSWK